MTAKKFDIVNFNTFVDRYMANGKQPFAKGSAAIQVYPLSIASQFIDPPTPLFKTAYNYLLLFTDGGGVQQVDNAIVSLQTNDVLFIREGHLNAVQAIHPNTTGYYIYIDSSRLSAIFTNETLLNRFTFQPKHRVAATDMQWLVRCCELIGKQDPDSPLAQETRAALIRAILLKLAESWPAATAKPDRQSEITLLFKELLHRHFETQRAIQFYAKALNISENYLNRCVKNTTNKPPKQHINELLINYSKLLLQDPAMRISEVAFALNFSDPSYFGRLFKQLSQQSPSAYRAQILQDLSE